MLGHSSGSGFICHCFRLPRFRLSGSILTEQAQEHAGASVKEVEGEAKAKRGAEAAKKVAPQAVEENAEKRKVHNRDSNVRGPPRLLPSRACAQRRPEASAHLSLLAISDVFFRCTATLS